MLFFRGEQLYEGIDSIDIKLNPGIYDYLDNKKLFTFKKPFSFYKNTSSFIGDDGFPVVKNFYYLHLKGEFINHELPIMDSIAEAISIMISKNILCIPNRNTGKVFDSMPKNEIIKFIGGIIEGIRLIEFCFDFERDKIKVNEETKIIKSDDKDFNQILDLDQKDRPDCLFLVDGTTYYSRDYQRNKKRKSILKFYDREKRLLEKQEIPKEIVLKNPYKLRIEFVLKRNKNTVYVTTNNIIGTYKDIINRYIDQLAKYYRKYFFGKILVDNLDYYIHPNFSLIYSLAMSKKYKRNNELENYDKEKERNKSINRSTELNKLTDSVIRYERKQDKILSNPPDDYFSDITNSKFQTSFNKNENILVEDEDFTFFNDNIQTPNSENKK